MPREMRRRRVARAIARRRQDRWIFSVVLASLIGASLFGVNSLGSLHAKALGGLIVASLALPTIAMFVVFDPVMQLVRRVIRFVTEPRHKQDN